VYLRWRLMPFVTTVKVKGKGRSLNSEGKPRDSIMKIGTKLGQQEVASDEKRISRRVRPTRGGVWGPSSEIN